MDRKQTLTPTETTVSRHGIVECCFATFDRVDLDRDVIRAGAMPPDGTAVVLSAYGHKSHEGKIPIGSGTIRSTRTEAIATLKFTANSQAARETLEIVEELSRLGLQEWSFSLQSVVATRGSWQGESGVRIITKIGKVKEVSPVLIGAGIGTRTLSVGSGATPDEAEIAAIYDRVMNAPARDLEHEFRRSQGLGVVAP